MDSLALWGFAADYEIVGLNLGSVPRRSSEDLRFRVKNLSRTYTAHTVVLDFTGAQSWQYLLSLDGVDYRASVNLSDLAPGALTGGIYLRRITPSTAPLGAQTATVRLTADSWTYST